jgi:ElaB/YqjD/DUF883 family membrane-anchored ribosome-binding protein
MSTVYDPPYGSATGVAERTGSDLRETVKEKVEEGNRALRNAQRAAAERIRKISDSANQLIDTPEKRNVTIGAVGTAVGLGFLIGFLIGRATR